MGQKLNSTPQLSTWWTTASRRLSPMGNGGTSDDGGKSAKIKTPKSLIPFHGFTPQLRFLRSCRPETRPNSESHRTRDTTTSHAHRPRVQGQLCSATATSPAPPVCHREFATSLRHRDLPP
nr:hypothetical protein Iba_scaffold446CG0400 [Ipomoea batatas]GME20619.1 hypothetical protein Iba_scaffold25631CG0020 [Ipomoea batatas]